MLKAAYVFAMRLLRRVLRATGLLAVLERRKGRRMRWLRSLFSIYDSRDMASLDLPWWTFRAIDAVGRFLAAREGQARVFEYGAGASTVWLARRAASVASVEHDPAFMQSMAAVFSGCANATVMLVRSAPATGVPGEARSQRKGWEDQDFSAYVAAIDRVEGAFDVIIIDGRARNACLTYAMKRLAAGGIIVFDNSDRRRYRAAISSSGLEATVCRGLAPALPCPSQTTILRFPP